MWFMNNALAEAGQCGRRRHRIHAPLRTRRHGLHVGEDGEGGASTSKALGNGSAATMEAKLLTGRFFMERMLPETGAPRDAHPGRIAIR